MLLSILFGLILMVCSISFGFSMTPLLIMIGVMTASDDPNNGKREVFIGLFVCAFAIIAPVSAFIFGGYLISQAF